ncbi:aldo/keto reductase [Streptomyces parvulus]|uniref:aldo/keto reductase n=1 Tax=Streptomyces parvulus TaxID=146923 RepID=UPI0033C20DA0
MFDLLVGERSRGHDTICLPARWRRPPIRCSVHRGRPTAAERELLVTTKVGVARTGPDGEWRLDGRPAVLRDQVEQALRRLRVERIELLRLHRIDPETPLADQLGTLRELRDEGKVGRIGLSEVTGDELDRARRIVDVASVQNRYNLLDREHEPVPAACEAAGIAFLPSRPVAWGEPGQRSEVAAVAAEAGATPSRIALAWLLGHSPVVLPIPGTARIAHLEENLAAEGVELSPAQRELARRPLREPGRRNGAVAPRRGSGRHG